MCWRYRPAWDPRARLRPRRVRESGPVLVGVCGGLCVGPRQTRSGTPRGVNRAEERLQLVADGAVV